MQLAKKILFLLFTLSFQSLHCNAQSNQASGNITIYLKSEKKNNLIEFVTCKLYKNNDSIIFKGGFSNNVGLVYFDQIPFGDYHAIISSSNTVNDTVNIALDQANPKFITTIILKPINSLESVEIRREIKLINNSIDKKTYNVSKDMSLRGGTANDVLRRLPGIELDESGNISLRGDGSVNLLINGNQSSLSGINGSTLLDGLPASAIEKVEIINNPSAKYDPDGNSGIINIVLSKKKERGLNIISNLNLGSGDLNNGNVIDGSVSANYWSGKLYLSSSYSSRHLKGFRNNYSDITQSFANDSINYLDQNRIGTDLNYSQNFRFGLDYTVSNTFKIGLDLLGVLGQRDRTGDLWNNLYDQNNNRIGLWNRYAYDPTNRKNIELSAYINHDFKNKKGKWKILINNSIGKRNIEGFYDETHYKADSSYQIADPILQHLENTENNNILSSQFDFSYIFPEQKIKIESGLKAIIAYQDVNTYSEAFDYNSNTYQSDTLANFSYKYNENIYSAYGIFGQELNKLKYQIGIRAEQAFQIPQLVNDTSISNQYFNLFPSAHLKYMPKKTIELGLSYSKRINRASSSQLNPFTSYADPLNLRNGNPYLRPEYINSLEAAFLYQIKDISFSASTYYRSSNDVISRIKYFNQNNTNIITYGNIYSTESYGQEFIFNLKLFSRWKHSISVNGNYIKYYDENESVVQKGYNLIAKYNTSIEFWNKTAVAQFNYNYNGPRVILQGIAQRKGPLDVAFEKKIENKNGTFFIGARVSDLFNQMEFYIELEQDNFNQISRYKWLSRRFFITLKYKFSSIKNSSRKIIVTPPETMW